MNKNNGYFLVLVALGVGIVIGYFSARPAPTDAAKPDFSQAEKIRELESQLIDARKNLAALQQTYSTALPSSVPAASYSVASDRTAAPAQTAPDQEKMLDLERQLITQKLKEKSQWLVDGYAKSRNFDPGMAMQQKFDEETVDISWAKEQENKLLTAFSSKPELAEFALVDTKCKSSLCQVSISFTDLEQANKIAEQVSKSVAAADQLTSVVAAPNAERKVTTLYISHSDEKLINN